MTEYSDVPLVADAGADTDAQARARALDPAQSFCVSAPAGSGKTELLTQRILALLPRVERPEQVLAITFTRKAAAEMRDRVLEKLEEARLGTPVGEPHEEKTRQLALGVLEHARTCGWSLAPDTLNLRTIDSLCADLTRQMPILSGIGGAVEVTDQHTPLYERAVAGLFDQLETDTATGAGLRALLLHFDNDWQKVRTLLVRLLGRRGDWGGHLGMHYTPEASESALRGAVESLVTNMLSATQVALAEHFHDLRAILAIACENRGLPEPELGLEPQYLRHWVTATELLLTTLGQWRKPGGINVKLGFPPKSPEKARMSELLTDIQTDERLALLNEVRLLPDLEAGDAWDLVLHLSHLLPMLQAELLLVFQAVGQVDYTHIALAAESALGTDDEPTDLALRLDYQIDHILIDEFQDTSDQQFRLLKKLTRGWSDHNGTEAAPRTLFIVGDGMQSIYGFRYANVGLFLEARDHGVGGLSLEPLQLTRNFRSQAGLVSWVNRVFADLLPPQDDISKGRVRHTHAQAIHPELAEPAVETHVFQQEAARAEAEFVADQIASLRGQNPEASIAVLVRAKSHARDIIEQLRQRNVAFVGRDLERLDGSPTVMDLMSLCRWLANPADDVASLALLRAPFCGLKLSQIYSVLVDQPRPLVLRQALRDGASRLDRDGAARARHLCRVLDWAVERRDRLALPIWIEQVWRKLGGHSVNPETSESDSRRFFALLRKAEQLSIGLDVDWLHRQLEQLFADHPVAGNPVEFMTLHKSKGLQFDYVFLPMLHKGVSSTDRELLRWHLHIEQGEERLIIAADDRAPTGTPSLYNYLNALQKMKDAAELRRLLYVGITRARYQVWLTGQASAAKEWPQPPSKGSPLGVLAEVIASELVYHDSAVSADSVAEAPMPQLERLALSDLPDMAASFDADDHDRTRRMCDRLGEDGNLVQRATGIAVHRGLELLATMSSLPAVVDEALCSAVELSLVSEGLHGDVLQAALNSVVEQLNQTLSDPQGCWLLQRHSWSSTELALCVRSDVKEGDALTTRIIDRAFIDSASGVLWIVDYKTSAPSDDEPLEQFISREVTHYRDQLAGYIEAVTSLLEVDGNQSALLWDGESTPVSEVRAALYFPALPVWCDATEQLRDC